MEIIGENNLLTTQYKRLISNSKLRRLGYLKILVYMFDQYKEIPIKFINTYFEKYCEQFLDDLLLYKNDKGIVKVTKTGNSAKPYIDLAIGLNLIQKCNGETYTLGKRGKLLLLCSNEIFPRVDNVFVLTIIEKLFFLECFLYEDYWYFFILVKCITETKSCDLSVLKNVFKDNLYEYILKVPNKIAFQDIRNKITEWSDSYAEHIIMPRLNWLLDLGLIKASGKKYFLKDSIFDLYNYLREWNSLYPYSITSPQSLIESFFMSLASRIYSMTERSFDDSDMEDFHWCINICFDKLRTLAPNRIVYSTTSAFVRYFFFNKKILLEDKQIKKLFDNKKVNGYICMMQKQFNDGYIQKTI